MDHYQPCCIPTLSEFLDADIKLCKITVQLPVQDDDEDYNTKVLVIHGMPDCEDESDGRLVIDLDAKGVTKRKIRDFQTKSTARRKSTKRKATDDLEGPTRKVCKTNRLAGKINDGMFDEREFML